MLEEKFKMVGPCIVRCHFCILVSVSRNIVPFVVAAGFHRDGRVGGE